MSMSMSLRFSNVRGYVFQKLIHKIEIHTSIMSLSFASNILNRSLTYGCPFKCMKCVNNLQKATYSSVTTKTLHDVNTNVAKDVILFKYENPKFFKYMNIFAVVQYMFWTYSGMFVFSTLKDAPVDESMITENTPWFRKINLGENKYRNGLGTLAVVIGKFF